MKVSFRKNLLVSSLSPSCHFVSFLSQVALGGFVALPYVGTFVKPKKVAPDKIDNGGDDDGIGDDDGTGDTDRIGDDGIGDGCDEEEDSRERHWSGGTWTSLGIPMDSPSILAAQCSKDQSGFSISSFEGLMIIIKIMIMMQFIS